MVHEQPASDNARRLRGSNRLRPEQKDLAAVEPGAPGNTGLDRSLSSHEAEQRGRKAMQQQSNQEQVPQQKADRAGKPVPEKGLGYYPITDLQFDVITLVYEKSKALQAYDHYLRDSQAKPELMKVIEQLKSDDRKHVEMLKDFLGNC